MAARGGKDERSSGTPVSMPEGTPSLASPHDHSWTLQAVMEMQKSVGILGEKVDRLSSDISGLDSKMNGFGEKLDKVKHWQAVVSGGAIVVAAVAAIIWSVITFVPWDRVRIEPAPTSAVSAEPLKEQGDRSRPSG